MIYPCKCKDYNGGQCYNCLNGAHHICEARGGCKAKTDGIGLKLVFGKSKNPTPIMDDEDLFKQRSFNLRTSELSKLKSIASKLGCKFNGESSVGRMLRMISGGELKIVKG